MRCSCGTHASWELVSTREPLCAHHAASEARRGRLVIPLVPASRAWATPPPMPTVMSRG